MLNQKRSDLSEVQIEVIDTLIGYAEEEKIKTKQLASRRLLAARRGIEEPKEKKRSAHNINVEPWFDDLTLTC